VRVGSDIHGTGACVEYDGTHGGCRDSQSIRPCVSLRVRNDVDVRCAPCRVLEKDLRLRAGSAVARPCPAGIGSIARLFGLVCLLQRTGDDESPLRPRLYGERFSEGQQLHRDRVCRGDSHRREEMPGIVRGSAHIHRAGDGSSARRNYRQHAIRAGFTALGNYWAHPERVRAGNRSHLPGGHALPGRDLLTLSLQALQRHPPGDGARRSDRFLWRRSRQFYFPALRSRCDAASRLRKQSALQADRLSQVEREWRRRERAGFRHRKSGNDATAQHSCSDGVFARHGVPRAAGRLQADARHLQPAGEDRYEFDTPLSERGLWLRELPEGSQGLLCRFD